MSKTTTRVSILAMLAVAPWLGAVQAEPIAAACDPSAPEDGESVLCLGTGPGIVDDALDEAEITVAEGAEITDGGDQAFLFKDEVTLTNYGSIRSDNDHAIEGDDEASITNEGSILSTDKDAINLDNDAYVGNSGSIQGDDEGLQLGKDAEVINAGSIIGGDNAITAEEGLELTNQDGGEITGQDEEGDGIAVSYSDEDDPDFDELATSTVRNYGEITGGDRGVDIFGNGIVLNYAGATITGQNSDGVRVEDGLIEVTNWGVIDGDDEAIQVGDDAVVINHGTLWSGDKGIQAEDGATITNTGTINPGTEGIEAGDDAYILNTGTINASDDAINAGENAEILNRGDLLVDGDQDGIDIDSGTVTNYGRIISYGSEDGIDFDASEVELSTITNYGLIEGEIGINVELGDHDPANTMSQYVVNHGTITGRGGLALQLGAGDDTLELYSLDINGDVDLGEGEDSLIVHSTVRDGVVTFISDPEDIDLSDAPNAVYDDLTLAVASTESFAGLDTVLTGQVAGFGKSVLGFSGTSAPEGVLSFMSAPAGSFWAVGSAGVFEGQGNGRLTLGRDFASYGLFLSWGSVHTDVASDHEMDHRSALVGLRSGKVLAGGTQVDAMAYLGFGRLDMTSAASASGDGSTDTRSFGLAASMATAPSEAGLSLVARAGIERQHIDGYSSSGLGGASFGDRSVTAGYLSAEVQLYRTLSGGNSVTPFLGVDVLFTDGEDVTMTLGTDSTRFSTGGDDVYGLLTLGAELGSPGSPWSMRIEAQLDENGDTGAQVTAGIRF
ncbi:outer membrane autotransporter [Oceanicola sp. S124]|uniref:outer membrane autotransporter n=1 Tax=Oceanicola sp. S124 TaxID=1042378 RepID=UPI0002558CAB|nr:outer membrane autotransporter [Oceanicola sp. S124]